MLKTLSRGLLLAMLGRRLPTTAGRLETPGASAEVIIRRDRWGIPYVEAGSVEDGWYGLGFCHGQDRGVQLEGLPATGSRHAGRGQRTRAIAHGQALPANRLPALGGSAVQDAERAVQTRHRSLRARPLRRRHDRLSAQASRVCPGRHPGDALLPRRRDGGGQACGFLLVGQLGRRARRG